MRKPSVPGSRSAIVKKAWVKRKVAPKLTGPGFKEKGVPARPYRKKTK